jgi:hypothetical protein
MSDHRAEQLAFLEGYCAEHLDEDGLDELVHEIKGREAAAINNEGVASQLEYILDSLGAVGAASAVIDAAGRETVNDESALPECFRRGTAPSLERTWRVSYRIRDAGGGAEIGVGEVTVSAPDEAEAVRRAVAWTHDNDPRCDERLVYHVVAEAEEQETEEYEHAEDDRVG